MADAATTIETPAGGVDAGQQAKETGDGATRTESQAKGNGADAQVQEQAKGQGEADWRAAITDQGARKAAERVQSLNDLALRVVGLEKSLSKSVTLPGKESKPEEVSAFRKALGVPEKPTEYDIPKGEAAPWANTEEAQTRLGKFAETAQKLNVSKDAFKGILDWYSGELAGIETARTAADDDFAKQAEADLRKAWPNYDREVAFANRGAEWAYGPDGDDLQAFKSLKTADDKFVADHPVVLKMLNKMGRAISEDSIGAFPVDQETAKGLREKLADLTAQQDDAMRKGERDKAQRLDVEIMRVAGQISGDAPIVGSMGRTA